MDGGVELMRPFCAHFPQVSTDVVGYPREEPRGYAELEALVRARLDGLSDVVLIAYSFSGPIAIRIAADPPPGLRAVILVASFASSPLPRFLRHFVTSAFFMLSPPRAFLRFAFLGDDPPDWLLDAIVASIGRTAPRVLSARLRAILAVDERAALARVALPMLYLKGARDRLIDAQATLLGARPDLRIECVDAPHLVLQCAPDASAAIVTAFLREHGIG